MDGTIVKIILSVFFVFVACVRKLDQWRSCEDILVKCFADTPEQGRISCSSLAAFAPCERWRHKLARRGQQTFSAVCFKTDHLFGRHSLVVDITSNLAINTFYICPETTKLKPKKLKRIVQYEVVWLVTPVWTVNP